MEIEEVDIPFLHNVEDALHCKGPFRMHMWRYSTIKLDKIPRNKWHVFHNMLLRETQVYWQIHTVEDADFILDVISEHQNQQETNLGFYIKIDDELMEELAETIQSSRIHKLVLRKDRNLKFNLSVILQALRNSIVKELRIIFEPLASEFEALASALQNPHLEAFFSNYDASPEYWSKITPILSKHQSIRNMRCTLTQFESVYQILKENKTLKKLELSFDESFTPEQADYLVSGLKSNSTLELLNLVISYEDHVSKFFDGFAKNQIQLSTLDFLLGDEISDKSIDILSKSLRTNTILTKLTIYTRPIKKCRSLAEALKYNSTLRSLRLRCDSSDNEGITTLCEILESTNNLTELNLSDSPFTEKHLAMIGDMIEHNKSIKKLILYSVNLDDNGLTQISEKLKKNKTLTQINLGNLSTKYGSTTLLAVEGLKNFSKMLATNSTLRNIEINCDFDTEELDVICKGLFNNTTVTSINLGGIFDTQIKPFETKIIKLLETNYALTTILPDEGQTVKVSSLLKRNKRLQSEARFKAIILSHNFARSHQALSMLPRELWCTIMTRVTHPGVVPLDDIIKTTFNSYPK